MNILWLVLGIILVALVAALVYAFFVMRPRFARQLQASVAVIAEELHDREPRIMLPVNCEAVSDPAREAIVGVGVLAVTEQGVVFGAGNPPRSLIIERARISSVTTDRSFTGAGSSLRKRNPMLVIHWQTPDERKWAVAFTVADPAPLVAELSPKTLARE